MSEIKKFENIRENNKDFMMIIYENGIREVYEITNKINVKNPEDAKKHGNFVGKDYNGEHPDPPPLIPSNTSPNACPSCKMIDKKLKELQEKEEELQKREEELESNWEEIRKK